MPRYFQISAACQLKKMGSEYLIFDPESRATIHLNESAGLILSLCDTLSVDEMIEALQEQFSEHREQIPDEVNAVINDLLEKAILQPRNA